MEDAYSSQLVFFVNGKKVVQDKPDPETTLLQYLRDRLHLTGAKLACGDGTCGSCTVMISHYDRSNDKTIHRAVTACLVPVCSLHGCAVITVEGVGSLRSGLHPIQDRLVENHGIQCGFCTPGMVMSMYALLRTNVSPSSQDIETALDGNLCRCTGYRPILQSFQSFSKEFSCGLGENCCQNVKKKETETNESVVQVGSEYQPYDSSQEPIFPSELQVSDSYDQTNLMYEGNDTIWYRPVSLSKLIALRKAHPSAILVGGFTSEGARAASADGNKILISVTGLQELQIKEKTADGFKLGAGLTVNEAAEALRNEIDNEKGHTTQGFAAVLTLLDRFASHQIRNMATLGGSLVANYSNSDVIVSLVAAGAQLTIAKMDGHEEEYPLISWCSSGKYTPCLDDGIILAVTIPFTSKDQHVFAFKQSSRAAMDRAIVNAGLSVILEDKTNKVQRAILSFGGMASTGIILAKDTASFLIGKEWQKSIVEEVMKCLKEELVAIEIKDKAEYRCSLALGFFLKFFHLVFQGNQIGEPEGSVGNISPCVRCPSSATQVWEEVPADQDPTDDVGRPKPHVSGKQLATGEALFYSDIPKMRDELFVAMVRSTKAHAEIVSVDTSEALNMPGVVGYVGHEDVPGTNIHGEAKDELIFAVDKVECHGQVIGGVVAETEQGARRAAQAVKVTYKELPTILTIEDAIREKSFYTDSEFKASKGDTELGFKSADHVKEGTIRIGAQDHFYMETQFAYVVPLKEAGEYEVFLCSQHLQPAQVAIADALDIPCSKVLIRQKRIGGSFGGKELHAPISLVLLPAAIAAYKFQRPVRCQLSREEDITTTGGRHPFLFDFKVGFMNDGRITAEEYALYGNGGSVHDVSMFVGIFSTLATEGAYRIPNIQSVFKCCKTNTTSPTAMRGFGQPQALLASNTIIEHIAATLGLLPEEIRDRNLFSDGDTNLRTTLVSGNLRKCWDKLVEQSDIENKRHQLREFNEKNRWKKRGLAVIPTMFPLGGLIASWYQALAHVNVYLDGSVLLSHGGVEMGQGINTKMIQIASRELGIPADWIHISETSTSIAPNATITAGSTGTDINGPAVMEACRKLNEGLNPVKKENPEGTWKDWIKAAYETRAPLSATGFFKQAEDDTSTKCLTNPLYYTYGVACTVVEVDCLTGEHAVLQTDIVMDVGRSLNPGIDIGQIEGAFMQGYGLHTMEETMYSPKGYMVTCSAGTYKIPTVADIPRKFNVTLLKGLDEKHKKPVYSSKGIGEPALALGSSAFFAIKDAVGAARKERGLSGYFDLDSPATSERIRMACCDQITTMVTGSTSYSKPEWRA